METFGLSVNNFSLVLSGLLAIGTALFAALGTGTRQDFFLFMGNCCCVAGNAIMAFQLAESNPTWSAAFQMFLLVSLYASFAQWDKFRRWGCPEDEDELEEDKPLNPRPRTA
jgi:membrane protein implicated in regulation of membrane protease activity